MDVLHREAVQRLFQGILTLQTVEECGRFFEDACTIKEIEEIAQRFEVATLLHSGKSYHEINKHTEDSTATSCRLKQCRMYERSGYQMALERIEDLSID